MTNNALHNLAEDLDIQRDKYYNDCPDIADTTYDLLMKLLEQEIAELLA